MTKYYTTVLSLLMVLFNNNAMINASEGRFGPGADYTIDFQYTEEPEDEMISNIDNRRMIDLYANKTTSNSVFCSLPPQDLSKVEDRRENKDKLRVISFNAEWLFLEAYNGCIGKKCKWADEEAAKKHFEAISGVIGKLDGDIVNLVEVHGCKELDYVAELIGKNKFKHYFIDGTDVHTGQNVGLVSKIDPIKKMHRTNARVEYPIKETVCPGRSKYSNAKSVSKQYFTTMNINGLKVAVGAAHLLAFPDNRDRCFQREAQATAIRQQIEKFIDEGHEIIFTGDMNDFDGKTLDRNSNKPISSVLDIIRGNTKAQTKKEYKLASITDFIPKEKRYSDWWDKNKNCKMTMDEVSMIDHILFTPGLAKYVSKGYVAHDAFKMGCNDYSDHWPVVAEFDFSTLN